jgi:hypothetical protein
MDILEPTIRPKEQRAKSELAVICHLRSVEKGEPISYLIA